MRGYVEIIYKENITMAAETHNFASLQHDANIKS